LIGNQDHPDFRFPGIDRMTRYERRSSRSFSDGGFRVPDRKNQSDFRNRAGNRNRWLGNRFPEKPGFSAIPLLEPMNYQLPGI